MYQIDKFIVKLYRHTHPYYQNNHLKSYDFYINGIYASSISDTHSNEDPIIHNRIIVKRGNTDYIFESSFWKNWSNMQAIISDDRIYKTAYFMRGDKYFDPNLKKVYECCGLYDCIYLYNRNQKYNNKRINIGF